MAVRSTMLLKRGIICMLQDKGKGKEGEDMSLYVTDQNYVQVKIF